MPLLKVKARCVAEAPTRFILDGFVSKRKGVQDAHGNVVIDLGEELERVVRLHVESVSPGEVFEQEGNFEGCDLRKAQWAPHPQFANRFELLSLTWGEHELLEKPGLI